MLASQRIMAWGAAFSLGRSDDSSEAPRFQPCRAWPTPPAAAAFSAGAGAALVAGCAAVARLRAPWRRRESTRTPSPCRTAARLPLRDWLPERARRGRWCWRCTASTTAGTRGKSRRPVRRGRHRGVCARPARLRRRPGPRLLARGGERWWTTPPMMRRLLRATPACRLILMGESMGGAVLMGLATPGRRRAWTARSCSRRPCGAARR